MSRLSEVEKFKKACEDAVALAGWTGNTDLIIKVNTTAITDIALRCLVLLAEIADMMEEETEKAKNEN